MSYHLMDARSSWWSAAHWWSLYSSPKHLLRCSNTNLFRLDFGIGPAAGETAAWRLKWIALPVMFGLFWIGLRIYRSILRSPERFCGIKLCPPWVAGIGTGGSSYCDPGWCVTIPARLRQRQMAIEAGIQAQGLAFELACFEYKLRFGKLPDQSSLKADLLSLPDPDGSIAAALRDVDVNGYTPRADVASLPIKQKSLALRGAVIRKASLNSATDDTQSAGLSYTNYELRLPGEDKILGTDDDWVSRDGVIVRATDLAQGAASRKASTSTVKP